MRILSIGNFTTGWDNSICDEEHIAGALEALGHDVTRWQRENVDSDFVEMQVDMQSYFDFALIAQYGRYPEHLALLIKKVLRCPVVFWVYDFQEWGQDWCEQLIQESDLYLSKRITDSKYSNWQYLSQDFAPQFLDKAPEVEKDIDVLFTGSYLDFATERNETLKAVDEKFNLTIHSVTPNEWKAQGFKNVQGPVMDDALPALIARAKINLSIDHTLEAGYWSDRSAQIMCCGGYVLFRYVPLSESVFGQGVDYFYNIGDCLTKIEKALNNEQNCRFVADLGYQQATWLNRLRVSGRAYDLITIVKSIL